MRFSEYIKAGIDDVATIYPEVVNRRRQRLGDGPYAYSETVSADIASIKASTVINSLRGLLEGQTAALLGEQTAAVFDRCTPNN
jgi:hypothetical protein